MSEDCKLLSLSERGLIPGPKESEEDFFFRSSACPSASSYPAALQRVAEIFHIQPDWVDVFVQSKGLSPWEGAATWIEQGAGGLRSCRIQIKDSFIARLYPKEEVIAHELVHAARVMFDEPRFEEILAYRTSKNAFRRYCGPLFARSHETIVFVTACFIPWAAWLADVNAPALFLAPLAILAWGLSRLIRSQRIFSSALTHLDAAIRSKGKARAVALALTDAEIAFCAKASSEEIRSFAASQMETSLRWKQLFISYF